MIALSLYRKYAESWWLGTRLRADRDIKTRGGDVLRAGSIVTVTRKYGGFSVQAVRCDRKSGIRFHAKRVPASAFTLLAGRADE